MQFISVSIFFSIHNRIGFVRLGEHTIGKKPDCHIDEKTNQKICADPPVDINVQKILIHQGFVNVASGMQLVNDIALLRLERPVNFTSMYCVMNQLLENIFFQFYYVAFNYVL